MRMRLKYFRFLSLAIVVGVVGQLVSHFIIRKLRGAVVNRQVISDIDRSRSLDTAEQQKHRNISPPYIQQLSDQLQTTEPQEPVESAKTTRPSAENAKKAMGNLYFNSSDQPENNVQIEHANQINVTLADIRRNMKHSKNIQVVHDLKLLYRYPLNINLTKTVESIRKGKRVDVKPVNSHPYKYILKVVCADNETVDFVYLIKSRPDGLVRRKTIRETYANDILNKELRAKRVFVVGSSKSNQTNADIRLEQTRYHDIVQEDFEDRYSHTALKTTMSFRWAVDCCPQAKFLVFIDDDVLVSPRNLVKLFSTREIQQMDRLYLGHIKSHDPPLRSGKWKVPVASYPFKEYPPYPPAGTIITNMEFAVQYSIGYQFVRHLPLDDIFVGIVAWKLGVVPKHSPRVVRGRTDAKKDLEFITSLGEYSVGEMKRKWRDVTVYQHYFDNRTSVR